MLIQVMHHILLPVLLQEKYLKRLEERISEAEESAQKLEETLLAKNDNAGNEDIRRYV